MHETITTHAYHSYVVGINGNVVSGVSNRSMGMNQIIFIVIDDNKKNIIKLKGEIIRIKNNTFDAQIFAATNQVKVGQAILFSDDLLSIELGPGLLGKIFDGLGNPLSELANQDGYFLKRGSYIDTIDKNISYEWSQIAQVGNNVTAGHVLGIVKEGILSHRIFLPFAYKGNFIIKDIMTDGYVSGKDIIAKVYNEDDNNIYDINIWQKWPIKTPISAYSTRLLPDKPLLTKTRIIDTVFPIAEGGTACIASFGSEKTILKQSIAKYADADIVIIALCGERALDVREILHQFTDSNLKLKTIIIANTADMPITCREASIYTAITMGEYYRQMGLKVLVIIDSISRWAEALREISIRLGEIPTEEGYPAYLNSRIKNCYERSGLIAIEDPILGKATGSLTLISTLYQHEGDDLITKSCSLAGTFLSISYEHAFAKYFPAISVLESYTKYGSRLAPALNACFGDDFVVLSERLKNYYLDGQNIADQIKIFGEDDISINNFMTYLKADFIDAFLQQHKVNESNTSCYQKHLRLLLNNLMLIVEQDFIFQDKDKARIFFGRLKSLFSNLKITREDDPIFIDLINKINQEIISHKIPIKALV